MNTENDHKITDEIRFLKRAEIFEALEPHNLRIVLEQGTLESFHTPGGILFQLGEPADALYIIKSGVVEICRAKGEGEALSVVAYLGESDTIGEMAINTGSSRGSTARIPQTAEIFKLTKSAFNALMLQVPEFASCLLIVMSKRLEDRLRKQRVATRYQHLSGDLEYFDLATVIQALAGAGRSGTLTIEKSGGGIFAEIYFDLGSIRYAKVGHLKGKQAVYQLFQAPVQKSFSFRSGTLQADFTEDETIVASTTGLLMECVHQQDELNALKDEFPDDQRRFRIKMKTPALNDPDTQALVGLIYNCLLQNDSVAQMIERIPYSESYIYAVLADLHSKGWIA